MWPKHSIKFGTNGLFHKLELLLSTEYSQILKSDLSDRYYRVKQEDEYSGLNPIKAGVPQRSVLGPGLYLIYTSDLPQPDGTTVATFDDGTAMMATGGDVEEATDKLQLAADEIHNWTRQWLIKLNEDKSTHVTVTNQRCHHIPILTNGKTIPHSQTAKYLGMTLDTKLRWKVHVKKKREELGLKYKHMYWLMGRRSAMSTNNNQVSCKQILDPVWTYGIQLWGSTGPSNNAIIQMFQNEVIRHIVDAPWYFRNADLHRDLNMVMVTVEIIRFAMKHEERLLHHENVEAIQRLDNSELLRRLKGTKPFQLVS